MLEELRDNELGYFAACGRAVGNSLVRPCMLHVHACTVPVDLLGAADTYVQKGCTLMYAAFMHDAADALLVTHACMHAGMPFTCMKRQGFPVLSV